MKTWHDRINDPRGNDDGPHIDTQSIPGKVCGVCDCKDAGGRDDQHLVNCGVYFDPKYQYLLNDLQQFKELVERDNAITGGDMQLAFLAAAMLGSAYFTDASVDMNDLLNDYLDPLYGHALKLS